MNVGTIRHVFLIEDHPLFRAALSDLLARTYPHCVFDMAVTWAEARLALPRFANGEARLVISDVRLPDVHGVEWLLELQHILGQADQLFILSGEDASSQLDVMAGRIGARAVLSKTLDVAQLLQYFGPALGRAVSAPTDRPRHGSEVLLSPRQMAVAHELLRGRSNKEIARTLEVGTETVKSHVSEIIARVGARNRTEAVLELARRGMTEQGNA